MKSSIYSTQLFSRARVAIFAGLVACVAGLVATMQAVSAADTSPKGDVQRVVTVFDQGKRRALITKTATVKEALDSAGIVVFDGDKVEPGLDEKFTTNEFTVNIYRASPVVIVDGMRRERIMSIHTEPRDIVKYAGLTVRQEDKLTLEQSTDVVDDGIGMRLVIARAQPITLVLYGKQQLVYTQATTVAELLQEKQVMLARNDTLSVTAETRIIPGMTVEVWRNGVQTITEEQEIPFTTKKIKNTAKDGSYKEVKTKGKPGKKTVTFEVNMQNGQEISRKEIHAVVVEEPVEQVEEVGVQPGNPLTKSKGAHNFVDSNGVSHRETYYDLPMNVVMRACGAGGHYTVRADGAKIDKDGYVIIAAHLGNYPRCSVVETSMGPGKVYDTGGFAARHPHGFDLATDWTNGDGR